MRDRVIFIIADEDSLTDSLVLLLKSRGYHVVAFASPREALAASTSFMPDLLLGDLDAQQDGVAVVLKALHPHRCVLLMTDDSGRQAPNGFVYLQKPVPSSLLLATVADALES